MNFLPCDAVLDPLSTNQIDLLSIEDESLWFTRREIES